MRPGFALTACLLLSGCFLMSDPPRFDDAQSVMLFGTNTATFTHFNREGEAWTPSDRPLVSLVPVDGHYLLHDPDGPESTDADPILHFVSLDASHWLMQLSTPAAEAENAGFYAVATWDGTELLAHAIACDDLRDRTGIAGLVSFANDDCTLLPQPDGDAPGFPAPLWQNLPPADTKLVLQP